MTEEELQEEKRAALLLLRKVSRHKDLHPADRSLISQVQERISSHVRY